MENNDVYKLLAGESYSQWKDRMLANSLITLISGAVMIGRNGKKIHRATILVYSNGKRAVDSINCHCSGTANGHAGNKCRIVNALPNCGT